MYAEVAPQIRMLPHLGVFDYEIAPGFEIEPGDLVEVDFRNNKKTGLVLKIKKTTFAAKLKTINKKVDDYKFTKEQLEFFNWFYQKYQVSPALALKTILPEIPKRSSKIKPLKVTEKKSLKINKSRIPEIKKIIDQTIKNNKTAVRTEHCSVPTLIHYNNFNEKIAYYLGLIKQYQQVLIVVPELQDVFKIGAFLGQFEPLLIHGQLSKNQEWQTWQNILNKKAKLIIGTKTSVFIPPQNLDLIILDQEEDKSHDNYDQNPKYQARTCVEKICELNKIKLVLTSQSPSVYAAKKYEKIELLQPITEQLQLIDMADQRKQQNYSWFSEDLINQIKDKKAFLLFNRKGLAKLLVCQDCHEIFPYQELKNCPECKGHNLKTAAHGTSKLTQELKKLLPNKKIVQLDKANQDKPPEDYDIVLGTEYALRVLDFDKIDFIGIISMDHQLVFPDKQASERVYQLITRLINLDKPMILQTNSPQNETLQASIHQNYDQLYKQEIKYG